MTCLIRLCSSTSTGTTNTRFPPETTGLAPSLFRMLLTSLSRSNMVLVIPVGILPD